MKSESLGDVVKEAADNIREHATRNPDDLVTEIASRLGALLIQHEAQIATIAAKAALTVAQKSTDPAFGPDKTASEVLILMQHCSLWSEDMQLICLIMDMLKKLKTGYQLPDSETMERVIRHRTSQIPSIIMRDTLGKPQSQS